MTMMLERPVPDAVVLDLPFSAESAQVARHRLHEWLVAREATEDRRDDARLLISELVGNAVRHARPLDDEVLRVEWSLAEAAARQTLAIAVTDGGSASTPEVVDAADGDVGGRGMAIVDILAHRWWVEGDQGSVTVRAELPLH